MKLRRRPTSCRWALWLFAAALLLKAAMPMLATASAEAQGKALVAVCTVYGMSMVSVDGDPAAGASAPGAPKPDDTTAHRDHHCALTTLGALATADEPTRFAAMTEGRSTRAPPAGTAQRPGHDAEAHWVANRKQGPPDPS